MPQLKGEFTHVTQKSERPTQTLFPLYTCICLNPKQCLCQMKKTQPRSNHDHDDHGHVVFHRTRENCICAWFFIISNTIL